MSGYGQPTQEHVLYNAEPGCVRALAEARHKVTEVAARYAGRPVRVQTVDGRIYEGTLMHCDRGMLYMHVGQPMQRAFFNPFYNSFVLPLVLYELLVITLLTV